MEHLIKRVNGVAKLFACCALVAQGCELSYSAFLFDTVPFLGLYLTVSITQLKSVYHIYWHNYIKYNNVLY